MNLEKICSRAKEIVLETGKFIDEQSGKFSVNDIELKSPRSYVTYVDKAAEKKLVAALQKIVPEAGFITEEETINQTRKKLNWVIDPLDGTTNFIQKIPCYAISVALMEKEKPIMGIVYEINLRECFYAWKGSDAFLNGKKINVSPNKILSESLIATGFPYDTEGKLKKYLAIMEQFLKSTRGVRRLGSAAVDLAYVACGRFDGFYEYGLNAWDVAAGALIVSQAGGKMTDFRGGNDFIFGREIVAAHPKIVKEMVKVIEKKWK